MPLDPEVPVIVADAEPGSAGAVLNLRAVERAALWVADAERGSYGEGIHLREVELPTYDDLFVDLEAARDALIAAELDPAVDPLP